MTFPALLITIAWCKDCFQTMDKQPIDQRSRVTRAAVTGPCVRELYCTFILFCVAGKVNRLYYIGHDYNTQDKSASSYETNFCIDL
jgi:hypothetical protein